MRRKSTIAAHPGKMLRRWLSRGCFRSSWVRSIGPQATGRAMASGLAVDDTIGDRHRGGLPAGLEWNADLGYIFGGSVAKGNRPLPEWSPLPQWSMNPVEIAVERSCAKFLLVEISPHEKDPCRLSDSFGVLRRRTGPCRDPLWNSVASPVSRLDSLKPLRPRTPRQLRNSRSGFQWK